VHVLSGHKEAITSISIHPSGKLALSVSKDNTMKLWNLVQGNSFAVTKAILTQTGYVIIVS
jgi:protein MAK11